VPKKIELTGQQFGHLLVTEESDKYKSRNGVCWICNCSCGKEVEIRGALLRSGAITSCGCALREEARPTAPTRELEIKEQKFHSKELCLGRAGEYLVMFDLLMHGEKAFLTDQGINYDIVVEVGSRLYTIQVKATQKQRIFSKNHQTPGYYLNLRRAGKGGRRRVEHDEIDIYACVFLDKMKVSYLISSETRYSLVSFHDENDDTMWLHNTNRKGARFIQDYTWNRASNLLLENQ